MQFSEQFYRLNEALNIKGASTIIGGAAGFGGTQEYLERHDPKMININKKIKDVKSKMKIAREKGQGETFGKLHNELKKLKSELVQRRVEIKKANKAKLATGLVGGIVGGRIIGRGISKRLIKK